MIRGLLLAGALLTTGQALGEVAVGLSGRMLLPQGGARMRRLGGGALTAACGLSGAWSLEGLVGAGEDCAELRVGLLGRWTGWDLYDRFFGFSPFDPFVTVGAGGWVGSDRGQVGPSAGLGAFYHLDDHWSLRADATLTLGLDAKAEALYSLSCGIQYTF